MEVLKRILVVQDEAILRLVMSDALSRLGKNYDVVTAQNGYEAWTKFRQQAFDLVITDLMMPVLDGIELTEAIRTQSPDLPVIWVTAHSCRQLCEQIRRLQVYTCVDKPVMISQIKTLTLAALNSDCDGKMK